MIDFKHPEYKANIERWKLADNICSSRNVEQYLIELNSSDKSPENVARNKAYKERAVFYAIAGNTLQGLIGLLFSKPPIIDLPSQLEYMKTNVDGSGVSIIQQAQDSSANVIKKGRSGLFTSYPKTEGAVSRAEMDSGSLVATINKIEAEQITFWDEETKGSRTFLSLLTIQEVVKKVEDYELIETDQIRELSLDDGVFTVRLWQKPKDAWIVIDESVPTDSNGSVWDTIPFTFIGSQSNTSTINDAPLYPVVYINRAHYRDSADWQNTIHWSGRSQPWMSGMNQTHVDMMKENKMYIGGEHLIGVPSGETFAFATADPNPQSRQGMIDKFELMVALGARVIQEGGTTKTKGEDDNDEKAQNSPLLLVSENISEAYTQAIRWAARYMGTADGSFSTTTDFINPTATAQDIQAMAMSFLQGAMPISDYHNWLKSVGLSDPEKTVEEFTEEVGNANMPDLDTEVNNA